MSAGNPGTVSDENRRSLEHLERTGQIIVAETVEEKKETSHYRDCRQQGGIKDKKVKIWTLTL